VETVARIQSAGCKAQKKSVIGAHNRCWKYFVGAITTHGEAKRDLEFIGGDKDRQLKKLWTETRISSILPWDDIEDEAERLLESDGVTGHTSENTHADQDLGDGQGVELDETDPSHEVIFGRRRPDSIAVDRNNKVLLHWLPPRRLREVQHSRNNARKRHHQIKHVIMTHATKIPHQKSHPTLGRHGKVAFAILHEHSTFSSTPSRSQGLQKARSDRTRHSSKFGS